MRYITIVLLFFTGHLLAQDMHRSLASSSTIDLEQSSSIDRLSLLMRALQDEEPTADAKAAFSKAKEELSEVGAITRSQLQDVPGASYLLKCSSEDDQKQHITWFGSMLNDRGVFYSAQNTFHRYIEALYNNWNLAYDLWKFYDCYSGSERPNFSSSEELIRCTIGDIEKQKALMRRIVDNADAFIVYYGSRLFQNHFKEAFGDDKLATLLLDAVKANDVQQVRRLLLLGVVPNPLHLSMAVSKGNPELVRALLRAGTPLGDNPSCYLEQAAAAGSVEVLRLLIHNGVQLTPDVGKELIHIAVQSSFLNKVVPFLYENDCMPLKDVDRFCLYTQARQEQIPTFETKQRFALAQQALVYREGQGIDNNRQTLFSLPECRDVAYSLVPEAYFNGHLAECLAVEETEDELRKQFSHMFPDQTLRLKKMRELFDPTNEQEFWRLFDAKYTTALERLVKMFECIKKKDMQWCEAYRNTSIATESYQERRFSTIIRLIFEPLIKQNYPDPEARLAKMKELVDMKSEDDFWLMLRLKFPKGGDERKVLMAQYFGSDVSQLKQTLQDKSRCLALMREMINIRNEDDFWDMFVKKFPDNLERLRVLEKIVDVSAVDYRSIIKDGMGLESDQLPSLKKLVSIDLPDESAHWALWEKVESNRADRIRTIVGNKPLHEKVKQYYDDPTVKMKEVIDGSDGLVYLVGAHAFKGWFEKYFGPGKLNEVLHDEISKQPNIERVRRLLLFGAEPRDAHLKRAVEKQNTPLVKALLNANILYDRKKMGQDLLRFAANNGWVDSVRLLVNDGVALDHTCRMEFLQTAVEKGYAPLVRYLLGTQLDQGTINTLLVLAVEAGYVQVVREFYTAGYSSSDIHQLRRTAVQRVAGRSTDLIEALLEIDTTPLRDGYKVLEFAIKKDAVPLARKLLVIHGVRISDGDVLISNYCNVISADMLRTFVDLNMLRVTGRSDWELVKLADRNHAEKIAQLVRVGAHLRAIANVRRLNNLACNSLDVACLLVQHGHGPHKESDKLLLYEEAIRQKRPDLIRLLLSHIPVASSSRLFMRAVRTGSLEVVTACMSLCPTNTSSQLAAIKEAERLGYKDIADELKTPYFKSVIFPRYFMAAGAAALWLTLMYKAKKKKKKTDIPVEAAVSQAA